MKETTNKSSFLSGLTGQILIAMIVGAVLELPSIPIVRMKLPSLSVVK